MKRIVAALIVVIMCFDDALICPDCVAIIDCDLFKSEIAEG